MGANFSSGNNVYVYVDKPVYFGGEQVQGQALLNCATPFQCNTIILRVEGYEKASWTESRTVSEGNSSRTETIYCHGYREFFKQKFPLQTFAVNCAPGQYQYPFSFVLPLGLPGSFSFHSGAEAKVKYKVKIECVVPGMLKANIKYKHELTVHQRPDRPPSEIKAEHFQTVKSCCCIGKGSARMIAHVQKDVYYPGETCNVILQVDNGSEADFKRIELTLRRTVKLHASNGHWKTHHKEIFKTGAEGIPAHAKFMDKEARVLSLPIPNTEMLPCVAGQVIMCYYNLLVVLKAGGMVSDVKLKVPVNIFVPPPPFQAFPEPPAWWHPTYVAQPLVVQLPSAPPLPPGAQVMGMPPASAAPMMQPQPGYPPQQPGYPPQQPGYPPQQPGYPPQQPGYAGQPQAYPASQPQGYAAGYQPGPQAQPMYAGPPGSHS